MFQGSHHSPMQQMSLNAMEKEYIKPHPLYLVTLGIPRHSIHLSNARMRLSLIRLLGSSTVVVKRYFMICPSQDAAKEVRCHCSVSDSRTETKELEAY